MPLRTIFSYAVTCCLILFYAPVHAQLTASFTADKTTGCSPLDINFTNTSSGASVNAKYKWDFGNGNGSSLKDAGAIFINPGSYEVSLTVTDQGKTSVFKNTVTVHQPPAVDFSASIDKGCAPLPVNFSVNTNPADGSIVKYLWDFGDGEVEDGYGNTMLHTYQQKQDITASLTIINSNGCQSTVVKKDILKVLDRMNVDFDVEKKVLCNITDAAVFQNKSTGPGTLSYSWDFGDGTSATEANPSHVFSTKGIYAVKLDIKNTDGCTASLRKDQFINAAAFTTAFETTGPLCANSYINFTNKSTPAPDNTLWELGEGYTYYTYGLGNAGRSYYTPGVYDIKMTNTFGTCKQEFTKQIEVKPIFQPTEFLAEFSTPCGAPVTVTFKDTNTNSVNWQWTRDYYSNIVSNQRSFSYTYQSPYEYNYVSLTATNKDGCSFTLSKTINVAPPRVSFYQEEENGIAVCGPRKIKFIASSDQTITEYLWTFGDGETSTEKEPQHLFTKEGTFITSLKYKLANGCTGTVSNYGTKISFKKETDFILPSTEICGNTPFTVFPTSIPGDYHTTFNFGDGGYGYYTSYNTYKYQEEGTFNITMIATNFICADTVVKTVTVKPPFPRITGSPINTCEGTRGKVIITHDSRQVTSGVWNFGDGTTLAYDAAITQVEHTYTKTGTYKVVLSTTNGACTVKDSITVNVLLKQKPVISLNKSEACGSNELVQGTISGLETNPANYSPHYWYSLYTEDDKFLGHNPFTVNWNPTFQFNTANPGTEKVRAVIQSTFFNCFDTTEYVPLKVKGPVAGFKQIHPDTCLSGIFAILQDTSKSNWGVPIKTWEWNFGNGKTQVNNSPAIVVPRYDYVSYNYVQLKVTDEQGCSNQTYYYSNGVYAGYQNLKASFNSSALQVSPGTTVNFTNTSTTSDMYNTAYKWVLGNGAIVTTFNAQETYTTPGEYTVQLIATNNTMGCSDTATVNIRVKYVNSAFSMSTSFVGKNQCLPALVRFINTSYNYSKLTWDFGDGTISKEVIHPSHVYTAPGKYKITLTTESDNGTKYVTVDSIEIKTASGSFTTDRIHSCNAETIQFSATAANTASYLWDFGDGTLKTVQGISSSHLYGAAGVYAPTLIIKDENGCPVTTSFPEKIIIDSLAVNLGSLPAQICSPKEVTMVPGITNIAAGQQNQTLQYHWDFGTGLPADTSDLRSPVFTYNNAGSYNVSLTVRSSAGCQKTATTVINASEGLGGQISGPVAACTKELVTFKGSIIRTGNPNWKWLFPDGTISNVQNPAPKSYTVPGRYAVKLIVDNNTCVDTTVHFIDINPRPTPSIVAGKNIICKGESTTLTANGGVSYTWYPAASLNTSEGASVIATPLLETEYKLAVTNEFGCSSPDSISLTVISPFDLQLTGKEKICEGESVQLTASGGDKYSWIDNTVGLSNTQIANPVVKPLQSGLYTVTATDAYQCFHDTALLFIELMPKPTVDAGPDVELISGSSHKMNPVFTPDVISWNWTPATYLSCAACPSPQVRPLIPQEYIITVKNGQGCSASDTILVKMLCDGTKIFIPTAFTPNNDGLNDRFMITGYGFSEIKSLQVFNRWGEKIFERKNFASGDLNGSWDGNYKGKPVDTGTYVYIAELSCGTENYLKKGTVTLIR